MREAEDECRQLKTFTKDSGTQERVLANRLVSLANMAREDVSRLTDLEVNQIRRCIEPKPADEITLGGVGRSWSEGGCFAHHKARG